MPSTRPTDRMLASHHEAGHMIACIRLGIPFIDGSIDPAWFFDECSGLVRLRERPIDPRKDAMMSLAGGEAERLFRQRHDMGDPDESRWEVDLRCARMACEAGDLRFNTMRGEARVLVQENWSRIAATGRQLDTRKRMSQGAVKRVSRSGTTTPA